MLSPRTPISTPQGQERSYPYESTFSLAFTFKNQTSTCREMAGKLVPSLVSVCGHSEVPIFYTQSYPVQKKMVFLIHSSLCALYNCLIKVLSGQCALWTDSFTMHGLKLERGGEFAYGKKISIFSALISALSV